LTGIDSSAQTPELLLTTNFWLAGRAQVPDGGALLIHARETAPGSTDFLVIVSPRVVDSTGKALKR